MPRSGPQRLTTYELITSTQDWRGKKRPAQWPGLHGLGRAVFANRPQEGPQTRQSDHLPVSLQREDLGILLHRFAQFPFPPLSHLIVGQVEEPNLEKKTGMGPHDFRLWVREKEL